MNEIKEILRNADKSRDGFLNYKEFATLMNTATKNNHEKKKSKK